MSDEKSVAPRDLTAYAPSEVPNKQEFIDLVKKDLIHGKKTGAVTETELIYFLQVCNTSGLNPITRQIYAIFRGDQMTIQAGIDGLRAIAERTGKYGGSSAGSFKYDEEGNLERATVTVYKIMGDKTIETQGTAKFSEYVVGSSPMWKKMPETMLEKCAEAKALRKAFPNIGQIYTDEEMMQAEKVEVPNENDIVKPDPKKIEAEVSSLVDEALKEKENEK